MTMKASTTILLFCTLCALQGRLLHTGARGYTIILSGGKHTCEGVVQMLVGAGDEQTSILTACSREFGNEEARVLCSQLGCGQGERVQKSRFEFNMTDSIATALFSYQCEGTEHNLLECDIGSSLCNVLNNRGSDIVAISCRQENVSPTSSNSALLLRPSMLYILLLFALSCSLI